MLGQFVEQVDNLQIVAVAVYCEVLGDGDGRRYNAAEQRKEKMLVLNIRKRPSVKSTFVGTRDVTTLK